MIEELETPEEPPIPDLFPEEVAEFDADADQGADLPPWLQQALSAAESMPALAARIPIWLPTFIAAWRAGKSGLLLSQALKEHFQHQEPMPWPDEAAADFMLTLGEVFDAIPSLEEALPAASDLLELGSSFVDDEGAREIAVQALQHLEKFGEALARKLLEIAFFAPPDKDHGARARELRRLFARLEQIFDQTLTIWIGNYRPGKGTPS